MSNANDSANHTGSQFQFPRSTRIYVEGSKSDIRVPMREVHLNVTRGVNGAVEDNQPVRVYDASGPWGDPALQCSVHDGLRAHRREWIIARGDVEEYAGREIQPQDDGYLTAGAREYAKQNARFESFPGLRRQ